ECCCAPCPGSPFTLLLVSYVASFSEPRKASMKIHEYQARDLLGKAGIPVPPATVVDNPEAAAAAFKANGAPLQVVKAQVFAGGRGKAGFVKLVKTADEAKAAAPFLLANKIVSVHTRSEE